MIDSDLKLAQALEMTVDIGSNKTGLESPSRHGLIADIADILDVPAYAQRGVVETGYPKMLGGSMHVVNSQQLQSPDLLTMFFFTSYNQLQPFSSFNISISDWLNSNMMNAHFFVDLSSVLSQCFHFPVWIHNSMAGRRGSPRGDEVHKRRRAGCCEWVMGSKLWFMNLCSLG